MVKNNIFRAPFETLGVCHLFLLKAIDCVGGSVGGWGRSGVAWVGGEGKRG